MIIKDEMEGMWEEQWMPAGLGANQTSPAPSIKKSHIKKEGNLSHINTKTPF
jgi:hypothetical protein